MQKSIASLWLNTSKNGVEYMNGILELNGKAAKIVAFYNKDKKNEKQPDLRIYFQQKKETKPDENQEALNEINKDESDEIPF